MREYTAGYWVFQELFDGISLVVFAQFSKIGLFATTKYLNSLEGKGVEESGERQTGTIEIGHGDFACQTLSPANTTQIEGVVLFEIDIYEVEYRKALSRHKGMINERFHPCNDTVKYEGQMLDSIKRSSHS